MQESLGRKLRIMRAKRGLSLREAARRAGMVKETISDIERGKTHPYDVTLAKLAQAYEVPVEDLLGETAVAGKAEAPEARQPAVTRQLAKLVDVLAGNEEALCLLWQVLEAERNRLAEMHVADDPEDGGIRGEFARAVERLAYVGLRLASMRSTERLEEERSTERSEALRQASGAPDAGQGAKALVEEA